MGDITIQTENLGKRYRIARAQNGYRTLRDAMADAARAPMRAAGALFGRGGTHIERTKAFWALRDLSFEVGRGDVVGIIGRNGAGKSTLLKILSRITEPTTGMAQIHGRVGSLLEVGTGFHPELTGRENVYLNGAILGMRRAEIDRKFDEIVAFSEVEEFLDTPVKRYSSGMYVRLAFAVAAHMDLEVLLIDEVLAVGDAAFQRKCLGKVEAAATSGNTVLFVSHNMAQIRRFCNTGIWLDEGKVRAIGPMNEVVAAYQEGLAGAATGGIGSESDRTQTGFCEWQLTGANAEDSGSYILDTEGPVELEVVLNLDRPVRSAHHELILQSAHDGKKIAGWGATGLALDAGTHTFRYAFPSLPVRPGIYSWFVSMYDGAEYVSVKDLFPYLVVVTPDYSGLDEHLAGVLNVPCEMQFDTAGQDLLSTVSRRDTVLPAG